MIMDGIVDRMFSLLISGDDCGARLLAEDAIHRGVSFDDFLREVMLPVAAAVEKLRLSAQLTGEGYQNARRLLLRLAGELRRLNLNVQSYSSNGRSQFVNVKFDNGILRTEVTAHTIDSRHAQIISCEIRGALKVLDGRVQKLVLDLSNVQHLSSTGVAMAAEIRHQAELRHVRTLVYGLSSESFRIMRTISPKKFRIFAARYKRMKFQRLAV